MPDQESSGGLGAIAKPLRPAAQLVMLAVVVGCAVYTAGGAVDTHIAHIAQAAIDAPERIALQDARDTLLARAVVDSPDRTALKSEMIAKHAQFEAAIAELTSRTTSLEHSGNEQTLTLNTIRVTLEQVQKDVMDIRNDQRAARGRVH